MRPLMYLGTFGIVVGLGRYHAQFIGHYTFHSSQQLPWSLVYALIMCLAAYGLGLPDLDRKRWVWGVSVAAAFAGATCISVVQLVLGSLLLPRFVVFSAAGLAVPWFAVCVGLADIGRSRLEDRDRVILVAGAEERAALEPDMERDLERPAVIAAVIAPQDARVAGRSKPLVEAVLANRGTVVVLDRLGIAEDSVVSQAATLHEAGIRVRPLSAFYDEWLGKLPISELERMSLMFDVGDLHRVQYGRVKRLLDVVISVVGVGAFAVAVPFVWLGNQVGNRGPLFYRQERVGLFSATFQIVKFRTMRTASTTTEWTAASDDRVTRFGKVLRRSHLDELPQVLNILRGQLSIVGPRPEQVSYVRELREKIPFYDLRHLVRPGLTGWAQVKYPYGASELDALEKLQYEFYYLRHQSLALDARIVGRTLRTVVGRSGR